MPCAAWTVTAFYRFIPQIAEKLPELRTFIRGWMKDHDMVGLVVLSTEGVNGTVCGNDDVIEEFKNLIHSQFGSETSFKNSYCDARPFKRAVVDIRDEIVGMKRPDLVPRTAQNRHLSPEEWQKMLDSDDPKILIDTRNRYETMAGMFKGAIDPGIDHFSDWGTYLEQAGHPKDAKIMIYCTGGIRCEKAILEMDDRGYTNVVQLRDGILGYLAQYPDRDFEGECYVFDWRVTVGQHLEPTGNFGVCPASGLTSAERRTCPRCQAEYFIHPDHEAAWGEGCSKNCRNILRRSS